jgi:hypothetical protein
MSVNHWPDRTEDRPYMEPEERSAVSLGIWLLLVLAVIAGAAWWYFRPLVKEPPEPAGATPRLSGQPGPSTESAPPVRHPLPDVEPEQPLPLLEQSDPALRELLAGLMGRDFFDRLLNPSQLVRRIVATVDNLPRNNPTARMSPLRPVPGKFEPLVVNPARYEPYVRALVALDTRALARAYAQFYPLFQRAYVDLGYPDRYFNDRVVEAIDDMLAAPELSGPLALVQPKVFYEYADPALEARSAGQKAIMRLGPVNAARVKAKLREIRSELAKR